MAFTPPPVPPNSGDPATFNARADAFLGWFPGFVADLNAAGFPNIPQLFGLNGTPAAPALSWEVDPNTGIYRPASDQLGIVTGGVRRALFSNTAMQLDVPMTGTAVQSSNTDTDAAKLMKVGAFGLGNPSLTGESISTLEQMNALRGWRMDRIQTAVSADLGLPVGGSLMTIGFGSLNVAQVFFTVTGSTSMFIRRLSGGVWSSWVRLDPVRGSNSNGEYVRFGDGTQFCWGTSPTALTVSAANGAVFLDNSPWNWTFPAAFSAPPNVQIGAERISGAHTHYGVHRSAYLTSNGTAAYLVAAENGSSGYLTGFAAGRWY